MIRASILVDGRSVEGCNTRRSRRVGRRYKLEPVSGDGRADHIMCGDRDGFGEREKSMEGRDEEDEEDEDEDADQTTTRR